MNCLEKSDFAIVLKRTRLKPILPKNPTVGLFLNIKISRFSSNSKTNINVRPRLIKIKSGMRKYMTTVIFYLAP